MKRVHRLSHNCTGESNCISGVARYCGKRRRGEKKKIKTELKYCVFRRICWVRVARFYPDILQGGDITSPHRANVDISAADEEKKNPNKTINRPSPAEEKPNVMVSVIIIVIISPIKILLTFAFAP